MYKGWKMEYGMWNIEYGGWELAGGSWLPEYGKILVTNLGINCVQPCANTGVQTVLTSTHKPQPTEQQNYSRFIHPQYPQPNRLVLHRLFTYLSTGLNKLTTDTEADFTTVST